MSNEQPHHRIVEIEVMDMRSDKPAWILIALLLAGAWAPLPGWSQDDAVEATSVAVGVHSDSVGPAAGMSRIGGEAFFLERISMPLGTQLHVEVRDGDESDPQRAVLAQMTRENAGNPPYTFAVDVATEQLNRAGSPLLYIRLQDPDGNFRFATRPPLAIDVDSSEALSVRLTLADDSAQAGAASAGLRYQNFQCGDIAVEARSGPEDTLWLTLPNRDLRLRRVDEHRGARFASREGQFWSPSLDSAQLTLGEQQPIDCMLSERRSPWADARDRGVRVRVVGNEPGWMAEVDVGEQPTLSLQLDYGTRQLEFPNAEVHDAGSRYTAANQQAQVSLTLRHEVCTDSMSGQSFPLTAELSIDEVQHTGCGRYLF